MLAVLVVSLALAARTRAVEATEGRSGADVGTRLTATCRSPTPTRCEILGAFYPSKYVWDDTHLTVAVQAAPNVSAEHIEAVRGAIETWDAVLRECFDDQITLTDVTGDRRASADIVLHYVPHAGGVVFAGYAICGGNGKCGNIIVSSEFATEEGYTPGVPRVRHAPRAGHALGLGHATNIEESTRSDGLRMDRGSGRPGPAVLAVRPRRLASLFAPLLSGAGPIGPGPERASTRRSNCA